MAQLDKDLAEAGYFLAEEIRDGRWRHVIDLAASSVTNCTDLTDELRRRCPGFSVAEYQRSLAEGMFASR